MRLLLEDFLAALVGTAAAQETATAAAQEIHAEDFPECAQRCVIRAIDSTGCLLNGYDDWACFCSNPAFAGEVTLCVFHACGFINYELQQTVIELVEEKCAVAGVRLSNQAFNKRQAFGQSSSGLSFFSSSLGAPTSSFGSGIFTETSITTSTSASSISASSTSASSMSASSTSASSMSASSTSASSPSTSSTSKTSSSSNTALKIGVGVGVPLGVIILVLISYFIWNNRKNNKRLAALHDQVDRLETRQPDSNNRAAVHEMPSNKYKARAELEGQINARHELGEQR